MTGAPKTLRVGVFRYDTTRALFDGDVRLEGPEDVALLGADALPEIFAAIAQGDSDVSELGLTLTCVRWRTMVDRLPSRRWSRSGVSGPRVPALVRVRQHARGDRQSRRSGRQDHRRVRVYGQDSGIWAKGILSDDYSFDPTRSRWVIGGLDQPMPPFGFTRFIRPDGVEISTVEDRALGDMLERGEIDALMPRTSRGASWTVRRISPDSSQTSRPSSVTGTDAPESSR